MVDRQWLRWAPWAAIGLIAGAAGAVWIARGELAAQREAFETDARIVHRLLSQRAVQHDAMLATLALLQPADPAAAPSSACRRCTRRSWRVQRRDACSRGPAGLRRAETRRARAAGPCWRRHAGTSPRPLPLVLAAEPASFALQIDLRAWCRGPNGRWPADEPGAGDAGARRPALDVLQPGRRRRRPWRFDFHKHLAPTASRSTWWPHAGRLGRAALGAGCWAGPRRGGGACARWRCACSASARSAGAPRSCCGWARWRG